MGVGLLVLLRGLEPETGGCSEVVVVVVVTVRQHTMISTMSQQGFSHISSFGNSSAAHDDIHIVLFFLFLFFPFCFSLSPEYLQQKLVPPPFFPSSPSSFARRWKIIMGSFLFLSSGYEGGLIIHVETCANLFYFFTTTLFLCVCIYDRPTDRPTVPFFPFPGFQKNKNYVALSTSLTI